MWRYDTTAGSTGSTFYDTCTTSAAINPYQITTASYYTPITETTNPYINQIPVGTYYPGWDQRQSHTYPIYGMPYIEMPVSQPVQPTLQVSHPQPPKPNPEEIEAQEKARKLLIEYLDKDNRQRYIENKPIEIPSKLFNDIRYQIPIHKLEKIRALKNGEIVSRLCLIVKEPEFTPLEDVMLTKLLNILHDEECVLRTANHFDAKENLLARLN